MTLSQTPKGPWDGLKQLPKRRRLPRSNLYLAPGPDLRERMAGARWDIQVALFGNLLLFLAFLFFNAKGATFLERCLDAAEVPIAFMVVSAGMGAARAVPFLHRHYLARLFLVGLPILVLAGIVVISIGSQQP